MIYADLATFIRDTEYNPVLNKINHAKLKVITSSDPKKRKTQAEHENAVIVIECSKLEHYLCSPMKPGTVDGLIYLLHTYKAPSEPLADVGLDMFFRRGDPPFEPAEIDHQNFDDDDVLIIYQNPRWDISSSEEEEDWIEFPTSRPPTHKRARQSRKTMKVRS